eukprot:1039901-Ditylum_brightwellii.AAC.1
MAQWTWTSVEQKAFELAKKIFSQEILLLYPAFNVPFKVNTAAIDTQLGTVISQCGMPIALVIGSRFTPITRT